MFRGSMNSALLLIAICTMRCSYADTTGPGLLGSVVNLRSHLPSGIKKLAPTDKNAIHYKAVVNVGRAGVTAVVHWNVFKHEATTLFLWHKTELYVLSYRVEIKTPKSGIVLSPPQTRYVRNVKRKGGVLESVDILIPWRNTNLLQGIETGNVSINVRADGKFAAF